MSNVTVITAVFNSEPYLRAAVESIAAQTRRPLEQILVDDCSSDGSLALAVKLAHEFPYVRVVQHETNLGFPIALNSGIAAANTEYVAILDSDDIAFPHWLSTVIPVLDSDPAIACVGGGVELMTAQGELTGCQLLTEPNGDVTEDIRNGHYRIFHCGTVYRRIYLSKVGGYNPLLRSLEDNDIYLGLSSIGRLINVGKPLVCYRRLPVSQSRKTPEFARLADEFLAAKAKLLREGVSVVDANYELATFIGKLSQTPRLLRQNCGAYEMEMAAAFRSGGRRRRALNMYLRAWRSGVSGLRVILGAAKCLMPKWLGEWLRRAASLTKNR